MAWNRIVRSPIATTQRSLAFEAFFSAEAKGSSLEFHREANVRYEGELVFAACLMRV